MIISVAISRTRAVSPASVRSRVAGSPSAHPAMRSAADEDFGADVRWFAMKDRGSSGCSESVAAIASPSAFSTRLWCVAR